MWLEDGGEDRRHCIDGLLTIGVSVGEDIGALHQRVDEGREALVVRDVRIESAYPLAREALPDDEHDIAPLVLA